MIQRRMRGVAVLALTSLAACQLVMGLDEKVSGDDHPAVDAAVDAVQAPDAAEAGPAIDGGADSTATVDAGVDASEDADAADALLAEDFESYVSGTTWGDTTTHGNWFVNFAGGGSVSIRDDQTRVLELLPALPTDAGATHAALVTSNDSFGDFDVSIRIRTVEQLRTPTGNPWEVAWILWHFTDNNHFYSLLLKTNGWEFGKEVLNDGGVQDQLFLATGTTPTFNVQDWTQVEISQVGALTTVKAGGIELTSFVDSSSPYLSGKLGLYTEDARVHFDDIVVTQR